jgi:hypothetical protein
MAKEERLYSAKEGAYMTRLALSTFRGKVSKLGIKGTKKGVEVFYTRKQLETIHAGVSAKKKVSKKVAKKKAPR